MRTTSPICIALWISLVRPVYLLTSSGSLGLLCNSLNPTLRAAPTSRKLSDARPQARQLVPRWDFVAYSLAGYKHGEMSSDEAVSLAQELITAAELETRREKQDAVQPSRRQPRAVRQAFGADAEVPF